MKMQEDVCKCVKINEQNKKSIKINILSRDLRKIQNLLIVTLPDFLFKKLFNNFLFTFKITFEINKSFQKI